MGITRPSLYATYGNKEELFHKALDYFRTIYMRFFWDALEAPTARLVAERTLFGYADALTGGAHPGCLTTSGALVCSEAAEPIRLELVARRVATRRRYGGGWWRRGRPGICRRTPILGRWRAM